MKKLLVKICDKMNCAKCDVRCTTSQKRTSNSALRTSKNGFTIAEFIIVVGIIGVIFAFSSTTFRTQRDNFSYNDSLGKVLDIIKTARNYAITSKGYWDDATSKSIIPKEGYGVFIDKDGKTLTLFANISIGNNNLYQYDAGDVVLESYELPDSANFTDIVGVNANGADVTMTDSQAVIIFRPPLADTFIAVNPDSIPPSITEIIDLTITLKRYDAPASTDGTLITINKISGFPEIEL